MASRRRRRLPQRRLPGEFSLKGNPKFLAQLRRIAAPGEIGFLDRMRMVSHSLIVRPPQRIADWTARNLFAPAGKTGRVGPVRLTKMQGATADLFQDPSVHQVTYLKGPRIGASFLIASAMAYFAAHENRPVMFYDRALKNARNFYEEKFDAIFQASPEIRHLLPNEKNSSDRQRWTDRTLTTGAGVRFRSVSDKIKSDMAVKVFADEAGDSAYRSKGKNSEGSKISTIRARAQEFAESTVFVGGTPTAKGECTVSEEYERSSQHEWYMQFPCCDGEPQPFKDDVREAKDDSPHGPGLRYFVGEKGAAIDVWYECAHCTAKIRERQKVDLLNTGYWHLVREGEAGHIGVRSWSAHSQDPKSTWLHIANEHIRAVEAPDKAQAFTNLWLARSWEPPLARTIEVADLMAKVEDIGSFQVPLGIEFLFCGIDAQKGSDVDPDKPPRMELVVYGVGANLRRRVIGHFVIAKRYVRDGVTGETVAVPVLPFSQDAENLVATVLDREFERQDGKKLKILRTCADVSYEMEQATTFVRRIHRDHRRVYAVRGMSEQAGRAPSIGTLNPKTGEIAQSFRFKNGVMVYKVGTLSMKDYLWDTLSKPTPGPQSWSFPEGMSEAFYLDLLAEHLVETPSGRTVWRRKEKSRTGEVWDCLVYGMAAEFMEREWTRFGRETMTPAIRISRRAIEDAIEAEAARIVEQMSAIRPKPPVASTVTPARPVEQAEAETPAIDELDGVRFELIDDGPVDDDPQPTKRRSGFVIGGRPR